MDPEAWSALHGAASHFPIALACAGAACDTAAVLFRRRGWATGARHAGGIAMIGAAAGGIPAVVSGLVMARGEMWGATTLRWHHLFVWPAFGLMFTAGTWRLLTWRSLTPGWHAAYAVVAGTIVALLAGAGFWGGELLHRFP